MRRLALASAAALTLAACGGGSSAGDATQSQPRTAAQPGLGSGSTTTPKAKLPAGLHKASPKSVAVITGWADTLRAGHPEKAAAYFDLPVIVQNAGPPVQLTTHRAVLAFNETLPCGAHVVKTIAGSRYTVATFVLTQRPGSPGCGAPGELAATAFLLRHGKISEWRRVLVPPPLGPAQNLQAPQPAT